MLIIKNEEDEKQCTSRWGNELFVLTIEEVIALLQGKTLGDPNFDEYGTFIRMETKGEKSDE